MSTTITVTESLIAKIIEAHKRADANKDAAIHHGSLAVNAAWEAGLYLIELKENTPHGEWQPLFKTAKGKSSSDSTFQFDYSTGHRYMKLAMKYPTIEALKELNAHQLKDAYIACEIMPEPEREAQGQRSEQSLDAYINYAKKLQGVIARAAERKPLNTWADEEKANLAVVLRPFVEVYNQITDKE